LSQANDTRPTLRVIKIGGNVINNADLLQRFLVDISNIEGPFILVHGGGNIATTVAEQMGIQQTLVDGRRITNAETLRVAVMVYAGLINKTIVANLQALNCQAMGFTGADGNLVRSTKRVSTEIDFGFVGDVEVSGINVAKFSEIIHSGTVPVICSITHDGRGTLLNTNADTMAARIAVALASPFQVNLTFCFEQVGVLSEPSNPASLLTTLSKSACENLKATGAVTAGMIPKLDNAFWAFEQGVSSVSICHAQHIASASAKFIGTTLV